MFILNTIEGSNATMMIRQTKGRLRLFVHEEYVSCLYMLYIGSCAYLET